MNFTLRPLYNPLLWISKLKCFYLITQITFFPPLNWGFPDSLDILISLQVNETTLSFESFKDLFFLIIRHSLHSMRGKGTVQTPVILLYLAIRWLPIEATELTKCLKYCLQVFSIKAKFTSLHLLFLKKQINIFLFYKNSFLNFQCLKQIWYSLYPSNESSGQWQTPPPGVPRDSS